MGVVYILFFFALTNFIIGFFMGYVTRYRDEKNDQLQVEQEVYCNGYEDGFYLGVGEYDPSLFRREIAEKAYYEYKGLKHGPTKH
jgi:hypothetical protein